MFILSGLHAKSATLQMLWTIILVMMMNEIVSSLSGEVIGALCKKIGAQVYSGVKATMLNGIKNHLEKLDTQQVNILNMSCTQAATGFLVSLQSLFIFVLIGLWVFIFFWM